MTEKYKVLRVSLGTLLPEFIVMKLATNVFCGRGEGGVSTNLSTLEATSGRVMAQPSQFQDLNSTNLTLPSAQM